MGYLLYSSVYLLQIVSSYQSMLFEPSLLASFHSYYICPIHTFVSTRDIRLPRSIPHESLERFISEQLSAHERWN